MVVPFYPEEVQGSVSLYVGAGVWRVFWDLRPVTSDPSLSENERTEVVSHSFLLSELARMKLYPGYEITVSPNL